MTARQYDALAKCGAICPIRRAVYVLFDAWINQLGCPDYNPDVSKFLGNAISHILRIDSFQKHKEIM